MSTLANVIETIKPLDKKTMAQAQARQDRLTKPQGSLGRLEELSVQLAGIQSRVIPQITRKTIITMAGDHGVVAEKVGNWPQEVTAQMVCNFLGGGAAINVIARQSGVRLVVVDMGVATPLASHPDLVCRKVAPGSANMCAGPAMTREQAIQALETGIDIVNGEVARGLDIVGVGDMGIGNTTSSSAICAVITGEPVAQVTGRGTGLSDGQLARKVAVVERALAVNKPNPKDPLDVLTKVGGFEIAGLAGAGSCPVARKANLNIRKYMREVSTLGKLTQHSQNEVWSCTTCSACGVRCPKDLNPYEFLIDIRGMAVEEGQIAPTIRDALESIFKNGNPWGRMRNKRSEWMQGLNVKPMSQGADVLFFVGCTSAYDPRVQNVPKSLVKCFEKAGLNFGVLCDEENCCGSEVYGMGEKGLFDFLVEENMKVFNKYNVKQAVTSCPHGYHAFKTRYNQTSFEPLHHSQLLAKLIDEKKLTLCKEVNKKVIYHDPCFLGKQNGVYNEPRKVIESIPGVKLLEFDRNKARSVCCEGGGGRMWVDIPGPRLAETRVKDAVETGADILAVACPYCLLTFEDAVKTTGVEGKIQIMDISELLTLAF